MKNNFTFAGIAFRIWFLSCVLLSVGIYVCELSNSSSFDLFIMPMIVVVVIVGSLPAFFMLLVFIPLIKNATFRWKIKIFRLLFVEFFITALYGSIAALINIPIVTCSYYKSEQILYNGLPVLGILFIISVIATAIMFKRVAGYFSEGETDGLT